MGKVSMAVRSAAMSHIEPWLPTILGRAKMRMKILKVVVVLLLSGSGDARPQRTGESLQAQPLNAKPEEWRTSGVLQSVREDSRYTWNSGSSTIPYINHYRDNINPIVKNNDEVSVDKMARKLRSKPANLHLHQSNSNHFWNSPPLKSGAKLPGKIVTNLNQPISNNFPQQPIKNNHFPEQAIKNNNLTSLRNVFRRHSSISTSKGILADSGTNSSSFSLRKTDQRFGASNSRVPLLNTRISYQKRPARLSSKSPSNNSTRDSLFRRTSEIPMNNSRSNVATSEQNLEFSDQRERFPPTFGRTSVKVESTTPFDHVAAIKKITSILTHDQTASELSADNKNNLNNPTLSIPPPHSHSNRHWNSKHSNRTKSRPPQSNSTIHNQNKVKLNKIHPIKNNSSKPDPNLKNWPNTVIQNAEDFDNYDKYTSLDDDLKPEETMQKPVPLKDSNFNYNSSGSLQEIVNWLKIPAFMANGTHVVQSEQVDGPISVAFDPVYQNLEPNKPSKPSSRPSSLQNLKPGYIYPLQIPPYSTQMLPNWLANVPARNKTPNPVIHNPQTQVSQNTVVHLINTDSKKPNKTTVASNVPSNYVRPVTSGSHDSSPSSASSGTNSYPSSLILSQLYPSSATTSKPGPNVHIGFTSYEENDKIANQQQPQSPVVTYDQSCPTILINSYTRINNTIQSKEGCTDLNIIINSHVFNTNVYKSTPSPLTNSNSDGYQNYGEVDKYGSQVDSNSNYQPVPIYQTPSGHPQWPQSGYYDSQKDPQTQTDQQSDVEVFQDTQISISSEEDSSPVESSFTEDQESDSPDSGGSLGDGAGSSAVSDPIGGPVNDSPGTNSLVRPAVAPTSSNPASSGSSSPSNLATSAPISPVVADDDDDDYDLSPSGIMDSIASVFTYFTFVNPLHYGFFSLAAAPFTALAAGVLGLVTFIYPWLFPSSFGFSRAYNNSGDNFWSNLEEVVRQSMEKYGRLNEWKSKRKKRKR